MFSFLVFSFAFGDIVVKSEKRIQELSTQIESEQKKLKSLGNDKNFQQAKINKIQFNINQLQNKLDDLILHQNLAQNELEVINAILHKSNEEISANSFLLNKIIQNLFLKNNSALIYENSVQTNLKQNLLGLCSQNIVANIDSIFAFYISKQNEGNEQKQVVADLSKMIQSDRNEFNYSVGRRHSEREELHLIEKIENGYSSRIDELKNGISRLENFILQHEAEKTGKKYSFSFEEGISWPIRGELLMKFGTNQTGKHTSLKNEGILIYSQNGSPVKSIASGVVAYANWFEKKGNLVIIDHKNGFYSLYGFNEKLIVTRGETIEKGQIISYSGSNPFIEKDCLYFELRKAGHPIDPLEYLE